MWEEHGIWLRAWRKLLAQMDERKLLDWEETFLDATFVTAKKGSRGRQDTSRERDEMRGGGRRLRRTCRSATCVRADFRTSACGEHTPTGERAAQWTWTPRSRLRRVIADRGYDSDPLRERLMRRGTELIAPYRNNNRHRRFEDNRKLRRYRKRWKIERTNAWLQNFRRIQVRYDRILTVFQGFFHCACLLITLRHLCN
jgi:transposase